MTFYQELQLNQAGSKAVIKNAAGRREKLHHTCIYMCKIAITMIFCMCFVMLYGKVFGDENSIVGVVVLLFLMVFKNADFGICMRHSLEVIGVVFAIMMFGPRAANFFGPFGGMFVNIGCIFVLAFLSCHNILMSNHSTVVLGYLLLYGYDVNGTKAFSMRLLGLLIGGILTAVVFYRIFLQENAKRQPHNKKKDVRQMKISLITVGKIKEKYLKDAIAEYSKRLSKYCKLEIIEVADEKTPDQASKVVENGIRTKEAERIMKYIKEDSYVVTLEIQGKMLSSEELASKIDQLGIQGKSHITFVIGGSIGLGEAVLKRSDFALSFSKMTFPHQLMRVILLEQIYRSYRINFSEPYHK